MCKQRGRRALRHTSAVANCTPRCYGVACCSRATSPDSTLVCKTAREKTKPPRDVTDARGRCPRNRAHSLTAGFLSGVERVHSTITVESIVWPMRTPVTSLFIVISIDCYLLHVIVCAVLLCDWQCGGVAYTSITANTGAMHRAVKLQRRLPCPWVAGISRLRDSPMGPPSRMRSTID